MNIYIKNMVCMRCVMVVREIFRNLGIMDVEIVLGEVNVDHPIPPPTFQLIKTELRMSGFELINNRAIQLVEKIKTISIDFIYKNQMHERINYSVLLAAQMNLDYKYLSTLFSSTEGITIEKYIISLKIERVKELLEYDEKSLSEIAFMMGYSSVAHLSGQFKKMTGITPSDFKKFRMEKRKSIDRAGHD